MADNTTLNVGVGGDVIATDELTTLNGGAVSGVKAQRVKPGWGVDASFRDISGLFPLPVTVNGDHAITYEGRTSTFRIPGRAGTAGQKLFSIHNATGSTTVVDVNAIYIHMTETVVKAITVLPPVIRLYKVTVLPTNGTAGTKVSKDSTFTSSSSVTVLQDASADGTSSATALTATLPAGAVVTQAFADRFITAAGIDRHNRFVFLGGDNEYITLRPLEGVVLMLDYTLATQNPITDMWIVSCDWSEYTDVL
jgi:hypothetical protein